jgi:GNAT superfamily N-acetyltransferase
VSLRLERLSRAHRPLVDDFVNDEPELVVYLRQWALAHQERDRLGRTWLALDGRWEPERIAGFFTLAAASLDRAAVPSGELARLPRVPIPAVLLARLAVDSRVQGQGVGTWLFDQALLRTLTLATDGPIGFRVLLTDAKSERVATFYERRGMVALADTSWPRRMVLDLKPLSIRG